MLLLHVAQNVEGMALNGPAGVRTLVAALHLLPCIIHPYGMHTTMTLLQGHVHFKCMMLQSVRYTD